MNINLRGTGGAGKSHIVRIVMGLYDHVEKIFQRGRRQPIGYRCDRTDGNSLWVVGHYETPCGGCDTITKPDDVYHEVRLAALGEYDVLFEGIIIQDDTRRIIELAAEYPTRVIALSTPVDECLRSIARRRDERGDARPLNPLNTTNRAKRQVSIMEKLKAAGLDAQWLSREAALAAVLKELHLEARSAGGGSAVAVQRPIARQETRGGQTLLDFGDGSNS